jgi:hypothetical protein
MTHAVGLQQLNRGDNLESSPFTGRWGIRQGRHRPGESPTSTNRAIRPQEISPIHLSPFIATTNNMMALYLLLCLHLMAEAEAHQEVEAIASGGLTPDAIADEESQIVVLRSGPGLDDRDDMVGSVLGRERTAP